MKIALKSMEMAGKWLEMAGPESFMCNTTPESHVWISAATALLGS